MILLVSSFLTESSLVKLTNEKIAATAYENAFLISSNIKESYNQAVGFAAALWNVTTLAPAEQCQVVDDALIGVLR